MDLTPGQRKAVFAGVVLALAALGAFLLVPALRPKGGNQGKPAAASQPLHSASPAPPPATPGGLGATTPPAAGYSTYSYTESAASYVRQMRSLITPQLAVTLARAYATPGVAQLRTQQKQVYSGTGQITALRGFGSGSMTFLVAVAQKITGTQGTSRNTNDSAVTVTGAATHWQVNDVEFANAGNT